MKSTRCKWCLAVVIAGIVLAGGTTARADDGFSPIRVYPWIDVPLTLTAAAFYFVPSLIHDPLPEEDCFPCDPDTINALDRGVVGFDSTSAAAASDVLVFALPVAAVGMSFLNLRAPEHGPTALLQDLLLMTEAVMITGMTTTFIKHAAHRPRPYMYSDSPPDDYRKNDERDYDSLPSGHTSIAFAIATSFSTLYTIRHPRDASRVWVWIVSMSAATATGLLRVYGGKHFWTDVMAGAALGSGIGVSVPLLHRSPQRRATLAAGPTELQLSIRF